MNTLRKHLDRVKGGGLARLAAPAPLVCLILSDVVGNPLDSIASGPTVPDPSSFQDAWNTIHRYQLEEQLPEAIRRHLQSGVDRTIAETLKPGSDVFAQVHNVLVGSNYQAACSGLVEAQRLEWNTLLLTTYLQGEARQAGQFLASVVRQVADTGQPVKRPACIAIGGETTVTLLGQGRGGRNQEVALGAVEGLAGLENVLLITLATDGEDGPTDAAGAVVTGQTLARATAAGLSVADALKDNNSYEFFARLGDLVVTGPSGTNVNDLCFLFAF
jgi:hydroxypyruvate reductase